MIIQANRSSGPYGRDFFTVVTSDGIEIGAKILGLPVFGVRPDPITVVRIVGNTIYFTPMIEEFSPNFVVGLPISFKNPVITVSFPANPTVGAEFVADNGSTYIWRGDRWSSTYAILTGAAQPVIDGAYAASEPDNTLDGGVENIIGAN